MIILLIFTAVPAVIGYVLAYNSEDYGPDIRRFWLVKRVNRFYKNLGEYQCKNWHQDALSYNNNVSEIITDIQGRYDALKGSTMFSRKEAREFKACADLIARIKLHQFEVECLKTKNKS